MREIEERAAQIRQAHTPAAELDPKLESQLKSLESNAAAARQSHESKKAHAQQELRTTAEQTKGLGLGLTAAYLVVGVPLMFAFIGWLIDRSAGSNLWFGILTMIGAVIGITMMVITLNRANQDR